MPNLKIPEHQVAGHQAKNGVLGPLIDDTGKFYKPLQNDERGSNELAFYTSLNSDSRIPSKILNFFPSFHGTQILDASDGSGLHPHLVMEDIVSNFTNPSVVDIKIGSRTWHPQSSEDYIHKCLKKDRESSTIKLGFRISGLRSLGSNNQLWQPHKKLLMDLNSEETMLILRKFVSSDGDSDEPDCVFASRVYVSVLEDLLELKKWFEVQTIYHFYSCSVLVVYDKLNEEKNARAVVKLVDFAHVVDAKGAIDHNFLGGLCSLIKFVKDVLDGVCGDGKCVSKMKCSTVSENLNPLS
ncbi:inositol polyphosphate multikinase beta [Cicer arietinum]|uniref:Inositol polyphosphate multikinase n=1 Tax=Cicer arietinum TaxID=3827 RepID=A0A1S2YW29_CICAR|nr:inositol polyphosphate multikinase beta [Cicer arietinum]